MASASLRSRSLRPPTAWVDNVTVTLFQTLLHSGWWSMRSASNATRAMKPKASLKSRKANVLCSASRPATSDHAGRRWAMAARAAGSSFSGMAVASFDVPRRSELREREGFLNTVGWAARTRSRGQQQKLGRQERRGPQIPVLLQEARDRLLPCAAHVRQGDVRPEFPGIRLDPGGARRALVGAIEGGQVAARFDAGPQHARLAAAKGAHPLDGDDERLAANGAELVHEGVCRARIDITGKAQGNVHVLGFGPPG